MFLVVGLGNPGAEYVRTRHNVGFMVADALAEKYGFSPFREKFSGLVCEGRIGNHKVLLLKPQTYMNLSGNSVVKAALFYKILPSEIVVIHDDIDLSVDQIRAKLGGGAGGHNGLKSIDAHITNAYARVRIGVGSPKGDREQVVSHVLSGFSAQDAEVLQKNIDMVVKNISVLLDDGVSAFSNKIGMEKKIGI